LRATQRTARKRRTSPERPSIHRRDPESAAKRLQPPWPLGARGVAAGNSNAAPARGGGGAGGGAGGPPGGRARRSHRATALDGFMIKATVVIIESIRRNDQEVHAQAAKPFEHWHGLLQ
jgi:hypothetical protein